MSVFFTMLRKSVLPVFAALFMLNTLVSSPPSVEGDRLIPCSEFEYLYSDGAAFCQGITTDGSVFYGTGCIKFLNYNAIVKIDAGSGEIIACNDMCLPADVISQGYSHLGDCAYYKGKIYCACEAFLFKNPAIMIFDAESLEFLEYHILPPEGQGNGHFPWLCIKDDTVYYTQARDVDEIRMLNLNDFSYKGSISIDRVITKITGGDILGGSLYLSSNDGKEEKTTYRVNLSTGETQEAFVRYMGNGTSEAEGLSISRSGSDVFFHYVDVPFASKTIIRTYRLA
jgi:hypothetical protein